MAKKTKKDTLFEAEDFDVNTPEEETPEEAEEELPEEPDESVLLEEEPNPEEIENLSIVTDEEDGEALEIDPATDGEEADATAGEKGEENDEEVVSDAGNAVTIVKCPHCLEDVVDTEDHICPICGNPLKLTADMTIVRDDDDLLLDPEEYENEDDIYSEKVLKNDNIDLFEGLSYKEPPLTPLGQDDI